MIAAVVLAAGGSSRLGQAKQLILRDGISTVRHTATSLLDAGCDPVRVVVGASAERVTAELRYRVGLSTREVAEILEVSEQRVGQRLAKARSSLKPWLTPLSVGAALVVGEQNTIASVPIPPPGLLPSLLQLGSTVKVHDLGSNTQTEYRLVTSEEADVPNGKISTTSPIGRALMGKGEGDVVEVRTPGGQKELEVIEFRTIHAQLK